METLAAQFAECLSRWIKIEVGPASKAHEEVREVLESDSQLSTWGVDTILIGSYARDVAIFPCKDVDVFVKLTDCPETDPEKVFTAVQKPLEAHYRKRAKEQRRSMTITGFEDDLSVDAVPAIPIGDHWKIPQTDASRKKNQWEETNPEGLTGLTQKQNGRSTSVAGSGSYIPAVKLVRQVREHHLGDKEPGGLYFEFLTYWAFEAGVAGASHAEILANALERIAAQLEGGVVVLDPAMNTPFAPEPSSKDRSEAASLFRRLAGDGRKALELEKCPAAAAWRQILGRNDRGQVLPLPKGCDGVGKAVVSITENRDRGPDESRRFA